MVNIKKKLHRQVYENGKNENDKRDSNKNLSKSLLIKFSKKTGQKRRGR